MDHGQDLIGQGGQRTFPTTDLVRVAGHVTIAASSISQSFSAKTGDDFPVQLCTSMLPQIRGLNEIRPDVWFFSSGRDGTSHRRGPGEMRTTGGLTVSCEPCDTLTPCTGGEQSESMSGIVGFCSTSDIHLPATSAVAPPILPTRLGNCTVDLRNYLDQRIRRSVPQHDRRSQCISVGEDRRFRTEALRALGGGRATLRDGRSSASVVTYIGRSSQSA